MLFALAKHVPDESDTRLGRLQQSQASGNAVAAQQGPGVHAFAAFDLHFGEFEKAAAAGDDQTLIGIREDDSAADGAGIADGNSCGVDFQMRWLMNFG